MWVGFVEQIEEGKGRSIPEGFQNLAIGRSVQEVITFCSIGGVDKQLQNQVMRADRL